MSFFFQNIEASKKLFRRDYLLHRRKGFSRHALHYISRQVEYSALISSHGQATCHTAEHTRARRRDEQDGDSLIRHCLAGTSGMPVADTHYLCLFIDSHDCWAGHAHALID